MERCPRCNSHEIHRTSFGSAFDRLRRWLTRQRPHRCHNCGWRGWGPRTCRPRFMPPFPGAQPQLDLTVLDDDVRSRRRLEATPRKGQRAVDHLRIAFSLDAVSATPPSPPVGRGRRGFWTTVGGLDPGVVRQIHQLAVRYGWETSFIVRGPDATNEPFDRDAQQWLVEQGIEAPRVLALTGSLAAAANHLNLDYFVDVSPEDCLDLVWSSKAKAILVGAHRDDVALRKATRLGIGIVGSVSEALAVLEEVEMRRRVLTLKQNLLEAVGDEAPDADAPATGTAGETLGAAQQLP